MGPDSWFRTATIMFPIGGAVILFALIVLAVRILRSDAGDSAALSFGGVGGVGGGGSDRQATKQQLMEQQQQQHIQVQQMLLLQHQQQHQQNQQFLQFKRHAAGGACDARLPSAYTIGSDSEANSGDCGAASALLLHNNYRKASGGLTAGLAAAQIANDLRSDAAAAGSCKMGQYSLLPQRCAFEQQQQQQLHSKPPKATNCATAAAAAAAAASAAATSANVAAAAAGYKVYEKETLSATPYWTTSG